MTTKEKIELIRFEIAERKIMGCQTPLSDNGRQLKAEVYGDVLRRHPNAMAHFGRVVRAVNSLIGTP